MNTELKLAATLLALTTIAACGEKNPQLIADQMTLSDATCQTEEIRKIDDEKVREGFAARCLRRTTAPAGAPKQ